MPPSVALSSAGGPQPRSADPSVFSPQSGEILLQIFRLLCPHDLLGDSYYEFVVHKFAAKCSADRPFADLIEKGICRLSDEYHWSQLSEPGRLEALQKIEDSPFFQAIRTESILIFYGNPLVWKFLGYEGPSNELGGYVHRGFDDLDWLSAE